MAIDGGLRDSLAVGTRLVARYKHAEHTAEVVASEDGRTRYRLTDGREFKSLSAAGSAVMGGIACNGWKFWSVEGSAGGRKVKPAAATGAPTRAAKPKVAKVPEAQEPAPTSATAAAVKVPDAAAAKARPQCPRCTKSFVGAKQLAHHEANADRLCTPA